MSEHLDLYGLVRQSKLFYEISAFADNFKRPKNQTLVLLLTGNAKHVYANSRFSECAKWERVHQYLKDELPEMAWGSPERFEKWISKDIWPTPQERMQQRRQARHEAIRSD